MQVLVNHVMGYKHSCRAAIVWPVLVLLHKDIANKKKSLMTCCFFQRTQMYALFTSYAYFLTTNRCIRNNSNVPARWPRAPTFKQHTCDQLIGNKSSSLQSETWSSAVDIDSDWLKSYFSCKGVQNGCLPYDKEQFKRLLRMLAFLFLFLFGWGSRRPSCSVSSFITGQLNTCDQPTDRPK